MNSDLGDLGVLRERLTRLPGDIIDCLGFFSQIPVRHFERPADSPTELGLAAAAWPLAGLLIALPPAGVLLLVSLAGIPAVIAVTLSVMLLIGLTGALHEDGLADVADGFGGGGNKAKKLAIMRDSRLGTYGVLALVISVIVRIFGLAAIIAVSLPAAIAAILAVAVASRSLALAHWHALDPARQDGLAVRAGRPDRLAMLIGLGIGALALVLLVPFAGGSVFFAVALASLGVVALTRLVHQQIGGHSGDTIGASQQIAEAMLL
ncbi:MAG: adenosylcobinamide-GDP ribazoletransferase, partial [Hyphomicrobiales bacterium]|nr:adenosylcobinamide-GDP ribazoletransferase [Hyphomicrobiales bacterium]